MNLAKMSIGLKFTVVIGRGVMDITLTRLVQILACVCPSCAGSGIKNETDAAPIHVLNNHQYQNYVYEHQDCPLVPWHQHCAGSGTCTNHSGRNVYDSIKRPVAFK